MLEFIVKISEVDYREIADRVMPIVIKKMSDKEDSGKLVNILAKYQNLPNKAVNKALAVLPQKIKDEIVINLIEHYEEKMTSSFNKFLAEKELQITFKGISVSKKEYMELVFTIDDIDYNSIISKGRPLAVNKLKSNEKYGKALTLISKLDGYSDKLIQAALDALSQDEKDDFVICILDSYEAEVLSFINSWADSNNLKITVTGTEIRKI